MYSDVKIISTYVCAERSIRKRPTLVAAEERSLQSC